MIWAHIWDLLPIFLISYLERHGHITPNDSPIRAACGRGAYTDTGTGLALNGTTCSWSVGRMSNVASSNPKFGRTLFGAFEVEHFFES